MKLLLIVALFCVGTSAFSSAQISIDLRSGPPYTRHFQVTAADGDPSAKTPEQIVAVNEKLAATGNTEASWELGLAYLQGDGVTQDLEHAAHLFEIGATKPEEKAYVGEFYENGEYFKKDLSKATQWFLAAGRPGDLFELAESYRTSTPPDYAKAAELYRALLSQTGHPEVRRAQMELGNLVIDGHYNAGDNAAGRALNLEWARVITQELLGQEEYKIAVDYNVDRVGLPKDQRLWMRYCKRAASYNIDLAQQFYGQFLLEGQGKNGSPFEGYAWIRLSSDKRYSSKPEVTQLEKQMTPEALTEANSIFDGFVLTREQDGAYYAAGDPLREPTAAALKSMADDDPDVQLRRAFALETTARPEDYQEALALYRTVRDRRKMDVRVVLGRNYLEGTNGVAKSPEIAKYWLRQATGEGSQPAKALLASMANGDNGAKPDEVIVQDQPLHIGGSVLPPIVIRSVDPEFSKEARQAKFSGTVRIYLLVDKNGNPTHIRVVKGVGMGLDEKALEAVHQYKFKPAIQNGNPVAVDLYIEVNFQIKDK